MIKIDDDLWEMNGVYYHDIELIVFQLAKRLDEILVSVQNLEAKETMTCQPTKVKRNNNEYS